MNSHIVDTLPSSQVQTRSNPARISATSEFELFSLRGNSNEKLKRERASKTWRKVFSKQNMQKDTCRHGRWHKSHRFQQRQRLSRFIVLSVLIIPFVTGRIICGNTSPYTSFEFILGSRYGWRSILTFMCTRKNKKSRPAVLFCRFISHNTCQRADNQFQRIYSVHPVR